MEQLPGVEGARAHVATVGLGRDECDVRTQQHPGLHLDGGIGQHLAAAQGHAVGVIDFVSLEMRHRRRVTLPATLLSFYFAADS